MSHRTMVGGTAYDITGGKTLVNGTSYSVQGGKVLVNGTAYDISFILPPAALDLWSNTNIYNQINCIAYGNGYWVVGGQYCDGSNTYARIAYATSLDGPWTTKDIWSNSGTSDYISCITYANGYWVVGGYNHVPGNYKGSIAYATSPDGTWTIKDIWNSTASSVNGINCITYANGYWVVGGVFCNASTTYARIAYATSPDGTWGVKTLWSLNGNGGNLGINCITYANGTWVVGGANQYSIGYNYNFYANISYATSPDGTWTTKTLWMSTNNTSQKDAILGVAYANGYWVAAGITGVYDNVTKKWSIISYATTPEGPWTTKALWSSTSNSCIRSLIYANGNFVVGGEYRSGNTEPYCARIAYATNPDGTWTIKDLWSLDYGRGINSIACDDGYIVIGGQSYSNTSYIAHLEYSPTLDGFDEI